MEKKYLALSQIKVGNSLRELRQYDNLYVPFGKNDIRMIEDIRTAPNCKSLFVRTDGTTVLEILDGPPQKQAANKQPSLF